MSSGAITVLAVVALATTVVLGAWLGLCVRRGRRLEGTLAAVREELAEAHRRVEVLERQQTSDRTAPDPDATRGAPGQAWLPARSGADDTEYVITTAGSGQADAAAVPQPVSARQFASAAVGESLVTLLSLGYGVRRALSAENRNRIAFEIRREVRRSRKDRRRELRDLRRRLRASDLREDTAA